MTRKVRHGTGSRHAMKARYTIGIDYSGNTLKFARRELVDIKNTRRQIEGDVNTEGISSMILDDVDGLVRRYVVRFTAYVYRDDPGPNPLGLMTLIDLKRV